tara:strand:+ start:1 stop:1749 length:1749 start_codon:yes stop_codon:yes gene_type:complete
MSSYKFPTDTVILACSGPSYNLVKDDLHALNLPIVAVSTTIRLIPEPDVWVFADNVNKFHGKQGRKAWLNPNIHKVIPTGRGKIQKGVEGVNVERVKYSRNAKPGQVYKKYVDGKLVDKGEGVREVFDGKVPIYRGPHKSVTVAIQWLHLVGVKNVIWVGADLTATSIDDKYAYETTPYDRTKKANYLRTLTATERYIRRWWPKAQSKGLKWFSWSPGGHMDNIVPIFDPSVSIEEQGVGNDIYMRAKEAYRERTKNADNVLNECITVFDKKLSKNDFKGLPRKIMEAQQALNYYRLGTVSEMKRNYEQAKRYFYKAIKTSNKHREPYFGIIRVSEDKEEVIRAAEDALLIKDGYVDSNSKLFSKKKSRYLKKLASGDLKDKETPKTKKIQEEKPEEVKITPEVKIQEAKEIVPDLKLTRDEDYDIENDRKIYNATVRQGVKSATMSFGAFNNRRVEELDTIIGEQVYPGTLNLRIKNFDWEGESYLREKMWDVVDRKHAKSVGLEHKSVRWYKRFIRLYPVRLHIGDYRTRAYIWRAEKDKYHKNLKYGTFVEIISAEHFRKNLRIKDGQKIKVEMMGFKR